MNTEKLKQFFERKDFLVHTFEQEGQQCAELECWTKKGVNMIIPLIPFTADSFIEYVDKFDVDEEIDVHRQDERYKKAFSLGVSLDDFNAYANMLDRVVSSLEEAEKPKHLYVRLNVRDGEREHTHHCVTSTTCESLEFAVIWYAAHFWGIGVKENKNTYIHGGKPNVFWWFDNEIAVEVETWKELTDEEANFLNQIMY